MCLPTAEVHRKQAENNEKIAQSIREDSPDWAVTICFYAALHWIECYAKHMGVNIYAQYSGNSPHERRRYYVYDIAHDFEQLNLRRAYEKLERESKKTRYLQNLDREADKYCTIERVTEAFQKLQIIRTIIKARLEN